MGSMAFGGKLATRVAALSLLVAPAAVSSTSLEQHQFDGPKLMNALRASSWRGATSTAPTFKEGDVVVLFGIKPENTCPHVNAAWKLNETLLRPTIESLGTKDHRIIFAYVNPADAQKVQREITLRAPKANVVADPTYTVLTSGGFDRSTTIVVAKVIPGKGSALSLSQVGAKPWEFGIAPHKDLLRAIGGATQCGNEVLEKALGAIGGNTNLYKGDIFHDGKEPTAGCGYEFRQGGDG